MICFLFNISLRIRNYVIIFNWKRSKWNELNAKWEWDTSWVTAKVYSEAKSRFPADNGIVGASARSEKYVRRWQSLCALLNLIENGARARNRRSKWIGFRVWKIEITALITEHFVAILQFWCAIDFDTPYYPI